MVTSRSLLCSACTVGWIARVNRKRRERAARSYFLEVIADTIERLDHIELDVACPELYAQPLDVAVDGPVVDIHLIVVSCIHQGVAAFHHSRPARQRLQDEKLGDGERDQLIFPGAGMPLWVYTYLDAFQNLALGFLRDDAILGRGAAQHDLDTFRQESLRKGFT